MIDKNKIRDHVITCYGNEYVVTQAVIANRHENIAYGIWDDFLHGHCNVEDIVDAMEDIAVANLQG